MKVWKVESSDKPLNSKAGCRKLAWPARFRWGPCWCIFLAGCKWKRCVCALWSLGAGRCFGAWVLVLLHCRALLPDVWPCALGAWACR